MSKKEIHHPDGRIEHPDVKFEPKDIRFGWILTIIIAACCVAVTHYFLVWKFYGWQRSAQAAIKAAPYVPAIIPSSQLPPQPRLEQLDQMAGVESSNVFKRLAAKEKFLNSYGPTSDKDFVHIPIRQAIKAIAGRLPVREESQKCINKDAGLMDSGQSNSGRIFRGEYQ
jgi:hypothetical protein